MHPVAGQARKGVLNLHLKIKGEEEDQVIPHLLQCSLSSTTLKIIFRGLFLPISGKRTMGDARFF